MTEPDFSAKTLLITGACGVTSRTIVRALRASPRFARTRLVGIDICDNPFGLYEGLYARIYRVPTLARPAEYLELVQRICRDEGVDAAMVVPEPEVLFWAAHEMPVPALLPPLQFARMAISKATVYETLAGTGLVPEFSIASRESLLAGHARISAAPVWLRDVSEGSTSGKGAICVRTQAEVDAWMTLNPDTRRFMVSEYLPGRNLACLLLYVDGALVKIGSYERLEYFMAKTVISGVSGNISKGRLINDDAAVDVSRRAVDHLCRLTGETMHGLVTVDLRCDVDDAPRVTEINLRQVAAASAFAQVPGANLAEAQLLATFGRADLAGPLSVPFPPHNRLFRDIDGLPVYVADYQPLAIGESRDAPATPGVPS
jgi:hypothetical protein